jgi:hypothetical protein
MAQDSTNANEPTANTQLSGDATRRAALKRLKKLEEQKKA